MIDTDQMLLVADDSVAAELTDRLGEGARRIVNCGDSYDALLEMSRRRWSAIVLTAPRPGFVGLCRASRRLQRDTKLFALCSPAAEAEVRALTGKVLDDYFIYPPRRHELRRIIDEASVSAPAAAADATAAAVTPRELAGMMNAARNIADLETHIAEVVARRCGLPVVWMDADKAPPDLKAILLAGSPRPRVLVTKTATNNLDKPTEEFLAAIQGFLPSLIATAARTESLHHLAITDHLTGAYNRRYFYHVTNQVLQRSRANSSRVMLLLFDIDNFKRYNDSYGHAAGDEILREVAQLIRQTTRAHDIVARIGGDEFAVLFWDIAEPRQLNSQPPDTAHVMADRFRRAVARHDFASLGPEARGALTISGGLAAFPADGQSCPELLRSADKALRSVKQTGKNAIRLIGAE